MAVEDIKYKSHTESTGRQWKYCKVQSSGENFKTRKETDHLKISIKDKKIPLPHSKAFIDLELKVALGVFEIDHHSTWGSRIFF